MKFEKKKIPIIILQSVLLLLIAVACVVVFTTKPYARFVATDLIIRYVAVAASGLCLVAGCVLLLIFSIKEQSNIQTEKILSLFAFAELFSVVACVLFLYRDFQTPGRLIEELIFLIGSGIAAVVLVVGKTMKDDMKKLFIVATICCAVKLLVAVIDLVFFPEWAIRTVDFFYVIVVLAPALAYACLLIRCKTASGEMLIDNDETEID